MRSHDVVKEKNLVIRDDALDKWSYDNETHDLIQVITQVLATILKRLRGMTVQIALDGFRSISPREHTVRRDAPSEVREVETRNYACIQELQEAASEALSYRDK